MKALHYRGVSFTPVEPIEFADGRLVHTGNGWMILYGAKWLTEEEIRLLLHRQGFPLTSGF